MNDAMIAGEPVALWEEIMDVFGQSTPVNGAFRGLRAWPAPNDPESWMGQPAIVWHDEMPWPETWEIRACDEEGDDAQ